MHPVLVKLGPITIYTYGYMLASGFLFAMLLIYQFAKKENIDREKLTNLFFYTILVALAGAKLFLFVTEIKEYLKYPQNLKYLLTSGGTFYGGLICGVIFGIWYIRKHKLNVRLITDMTAPAIALAHFFGRMGCYFAGCCWGRQAEGCSIAIYFPHNEASTGVPQGVPLYPTQVLEAFLNLLNFFVLYILYKKRKFTGQVLPIYIMNYSVIRFVLEYFRGDSDRGYVFGSLHEPFSSLSVPQLISILGFITAIILYRVFKKKAAEAAAKK